MEWRDGAEIGEDGLGRCIVADSRDDSSDNGRAPESFGESEVQYRWA